MHPIVPLHKATIEHMAGGKATSLGVLLRAGFTVPAGFVVPAGVYSAGLDDTILQAFDGLRAPFVAVRSSALNEDGAEAAWAGQLDTFLNVNRAALLERVRQCLDSARSERALAYAAEKGLTAGGVAVIVQAMVDSDVSGVAFSAHPVTGSRDHMVIEAGLGLGEAIVSGEIAPDTYVIETASDTISESFAGTQSRQLVREPTGENTWQTLDPPVSAPKLHPEQLAELADMVRKLADFYDFPIDVEWAFEGGKLYILQARPITTLQ